MITNIFRSYEGEGSRIGQITLFGTIADKFTNDDLNQLTSFKGREEHLYLFFEDNVNCKYDKYLCVLNRWKYYTIDVHCTSNFNLTYINDIIYRRFYFSDKETFSNFNRNKKGILKLLPYTYEEFTEMIYNWPLEKNKSVFIMPMFLNNIGTIMMECIDNIPSNVKIMPPSQLLIDIR